MLFGVCVACRILYFIVGYLYLSRSGSITSVGEERANCSAIVCLCLCGVCLERFPLPLGASDRLRSLSFAHLGLPYTYLTCIPVLHLKSVPFAVIKYIKLHIRSHC